MSRRGYLLSGHVGVGKSQNITDRFFFRLTWSTYISAMIASNVLETSHCASGLLKSYNKAARL